MAIGPVQLIVLGFNHPNFHGEIIDELERLRESDTVRVIDALAVHKDADGEIEVAHLSNLTLDIFVIWAVAAHGGDLREPV